MEKEIINNRLDKLGRKKDGDKLREKEGLESERERK